MYVGYTKAGPMSITSGKSLWRLQFPTKKSSKEKPYSVCLLKQQGNTAPCLEERVCEEPNIQGFISFLKKRPFQMQVGNHEEADTYCSRRDDSVENGILKKFLSV